MKNIVIIGAGLTGLSVALHLNQHETNSSFSYRLLEKCSRPGGLCKTEKEKGFLFDYTGHLLHFQTKYFQDIVKDSLGSNLVSKHRSAWIYSNGVYTKYPFQANLYGLPKEIVEECLYGFCLSYFNNNELEADTFYDWIRLNFGDGITRHFMVPYNQKLWRLHPREMTCDWLDKFVPKPDLRQIIRGAVNRKGNSLGYNKTFYYPKEGGIESLIKRLAESVNDKICVNQEVNKINLNLRQIYTTGGEVYPFDILVSTLPITELIRMLDSKPLSVERAANALKHLAVLNINFGINRKITRKHWIYLPEEHFVFYRIGFPSNFSAKTAPPGHGSIYTEISYNPRKGIDVNGAREKVVDDLVKMGIIRKKTEIVAEKIMDIPYAYVIYDKQREKALDEIRGFLAMKEIFSAGRYGAWKYSSMEDSILDGKRVAETIAKICQQNT